MNEKPTFVDEEYYTTKEKTKIFANFQKSIETRSLENMTNAAYTFYHTRLDFIAHYSANGFRAEYSGPRFLLFVEEIANPSWWRRARMSDLERACRELAAEHMERIVEETKLALYNEKVNQLKSLADELGYRIVPKDAASDLVDATIPTFREDGQVLLL